VLRAHLARRPASNPFCRYTARFQDDLEMLAGASLSVFHRYAFATFRQCGAAFELFGAYLRWLQSNGERGVAPLAESCDTISATARALQLKTARFVSTRRPFDPSPLLDVMIRAWDEVTRTLASRYGVVQYWSVRA
jgi:hypothetical protein